MATHSSVLAWEIPWTEEPGRLQSMGHKELDTTQQLNNKNKGEKVETVETDADSDGREHRFKPQPLPSLLCVRWRELCYCSEPISPAVYLHRAKVTICKLYLHKLIFKRKEGREGGSRGGRKVSNLRPQIQQRLSKEPRSSWGIAFLS